MPGLDPGILLRLVHTDRHGRRRPTIYVFLLVRLIRRTNPDWADIDDTLV
jgi:hypothetical protein